MDLQLQKGRTAHYCFVRDCNMPANRKTTRGEIAFSLEFVRAEHIVPGDEHSDVENIAEGTREFTLAEFAAWWGKETGWRVVDV